MLQFLAPLVSAGASLIGGLMNKDTAKENTALQLQQRREEMAANERQLAIQNEARVRDEAFRQMQFDYSKELNAQSEATQREFAQSGIQWRVQDAIKAGLHPLAALGGSGASFSSPSATVGSIGGAPGRSGVGTVNPGSGGSMGSAVASMGQDISRAMLATGSQDTRQLMMAETMGQLSLERAKLQNDLLKAQLASTITRNMSGQVGPPIPTDGPFPVPENTKPEARPPLMFGGRRWATNPDTSPMKAWEDQYGDEGPVASTLPILIMYNDFLANYGQPATWPKQIMQELWGRAKNEFDFGSNPRQPKSLGRR